MNLLWIMFSDFAVLAIQSFAVLQEQINPDIVGCDGAARQGLGQVGERLMHVETDVASQ